MVQNQKEINKGKNTLQSKKLRWVPAEYNFVVYVM